MQHLHEAHRQKVQLIADQLQDLVARHEPVRISKAGVSHFVPLPRDPRYRGHPVDISSLNEILEIDPESRKCIAEPAVPFADLLRATLPLGLIPTVVPELEGITVGGAVTGCSLESMSFRYGGFHDSCLEYEIVTGRGDIVTCSPQEEPFLFEMIQGSYGTLGILSKITFRLVPANQFVKMEYQHFSSFDSFQKDLTKHCNDYDYDFIDGIIHATDKLVLCLGRFTDCAPTTSDYRRMNIYYKSTLACSEDYLTTFDYCFRYDTECHWLTKTMPLLESRIIRFLLGRYLLGSTNLISWSKRLEKVMQLKKRPDVVCDYFIPLQSFKDFFQWYIKTLNYFPLWIVPYRATKPYPWIADEHMQRMGKDMLIDCAVYGLPNADPNRDFSQELEEKVFEFQGIKTLISRNHYSRERFWRIYNWDNYEKAKRRLDPEGVFPGLYEKLGIRG